MIRATAPVRICDSGGWTDTWFGGPGRVVNVAVAPLVEVTLTATTGPDAVTLDLRSFGERYAITPGAARTARHPLVEAAVDVLAPPADQPVTISVASPVPPGCGTGTSAAVAVALIMALSAARGDALGPMDVAYAAFRLEVEVLKAESGIQDQLGASLGGINYLEIEPFPEATVETLPAWDALYPHLSLIYLGRPRSSSEVHRQVIRRVQRDGSAAFDRLRAAAGLTRRAVVERDLEAFGAAMTVNTDAQMALHPALVGQDACRVTDLAAKSGALGWKVNGAGGDGGSITVVSPSASVKERLEASVAASGHGYRVIPATPCAEGATVAGEV